MVRTARGCPPEEGLLGFAPRNIELWQVPLEGIVGKGQGSETLLRVGIFSQVLELLDLRPLRFSHGLGRDFAAGLGIRILRPWRGPELPLAVWER